MALSLALTISIHFPMNSILFIRLSIQDASGFVEEYAIIYKQI